MCMRVCVCAFVLYVCNSPWATITSPSTLNTGDPVSLSLNDDNPTLVLA